MNAKKILTGIVLSAYLAIASPLALSQQKHEHKIRFHLKPAPQCMIKNPESRYFSLLQEELRQTGKDRIVVRGLGDSILIVPNMSKYSMREARPAPGWYRDDKFEAMPDSKWTLPKEWMNKDFYLWQPKTHVQGIVLYHWEHK